MEVLGVVGPVGDHGTAGMSLDQRRAEQHLTAMARAGDQTDRVAEAVGRRMQLGSQAAFGPAEALGIRPPF